MNNIFIKCLAVFLLIISSYHLTSGQEQSGIESLNEGNLSEKFDYLNTSSNNFREFKVVKKTSLNNLKSQVVDSISGLKDVRNSLNNRIETQSDKIAQLEKKIEGLNEKISSAESNVESISYLGIQFTKGGLKTLLSLIILGLIAGLVFMYFQYKNSNYITVKSEDSLAKVHKEFDEFKKRALEREQVLKREVMDLRNER